MSAAPVAWRQCPIDIPTEHGTTHLMESHSEKTLLERTFRSSRKNQKEILEAILESIAESGHDPEQGEKSLYLAVDEALTNAMEHGNHWNADKRVRIQLNAGADYLKIFIEDEGDGFDPAFHVTNGTPGKTSKRGRGLRIIQQFCTPRWNSRGDAIEMIFRARKQQ